MLQGSVKWFNEQKGFGFIVPNEGGPDVFVHKNTLERAGIDTLKEGQIVEYETRVDKKTGKVSCGKIFVVK